MSRRKQLKPMHILNNGENTAVKEPGQNPNWDGSSVQKKNETSYVEDELINDLGAKSESKPSLNGQVNLSSPVCVNFVSSKCESSGGNSSVRETPSTSVLADLSYLIPQDNEEYKTSEQVNEIHLSQIVKNDRKYNSFPSNFELNVGNRFVGGTRGRSRGRGRNRGRGMTNFDVSSFGSKYDCAVSNEFECLVVPKEIMKCRVCSKPFKRKWSLQSHELIHHGVQEDLPKSVTSVLDFSQKSKLKNDEIIATTLDLRTEVKCDTSEEKTEEKYSNSIEGQQLNSNKSHCTAAGATPNGLLKTESNSDRISPVVNGNLEENNNETASQSSETGSQQTENCLTEGLKTLHHTPMYSGITVAVGANFRELRRQVSLARRTCEFCGKVCFKPSDLQRHLMKHTGERPFTCNMCGRKFKAKRSLQYHQRASHGAIVELSPALEDKFAQTKKYRKLTLNSSIPNTPTTKEQNQQEPKQNEQINGIVHNFNGNLSNTLVTFSNKSETDDGSISSDDDLADDDDLSSGLTDSNEDECLSPKNLVVNDLNSQLNINSQASQSGSNTEKREEENKVPSSNTLNTDVSAIMPAVPTELANGTTENVDSQILTVASVKTSCDKVPTITRYKINLRSEEVIASRLEGVNPVSGEKVFLYKCHLCGKVFSVMSKLQNHLTVHMHRNRKQYSCTQCGGVFKLRSQWVLHCRTHMIEPPPLIPAAEADHGSCDSNLQDGVSHHSFTETQQLHEIPKQYLQMQFVNSQKNMTKQESINLNHIPEKHSPSIPSVPNGINFKDYESQLSQLQVFPPDVLADPAKFFNNIPSLQNIDHDLFACDLKSKLKQNYTCSYCGKYFDRPFSLQRHERMHTGVKPCYCKDCGRGFSEPRNLRHHIIRFHSDGSLHHLLRRNRGKDGSPRSRGCGRLLFGRNSLLKNAADFLNSEFDESPPTLEDLVPLIPSIENETFNAQPIDLNIKKRKQSTDNQGQITEAGESVTIVIPTEVAEDTNVPGDNYNSTQFWEPLSEKSTNITFNDKEILSDPKRSLIGNRKKRPHKLMSPNNINHTVIKSNIDSFNKSTDTKDTAVAFKEKLDIAASDPELTKITNFVEKIETNINEKPSRGDHWETSMTVASLLAKERGLEIRPQKRRTRGQSSFFPSYSLSLNNKPMQHSQDNKSQILSDGKMSFSCCYCNQVFTSAMDLSHHMDIHEGAMKTQDVQPSKHTAIQMQVL